MGVFMRQKNQESIERLVASGKNKLTEQAALPKDVVLGLPILTVTGTSEFVLENHRGILEYTEEKIRILTRQMKVTGSIENIEFSGM